MPPLTRNTRARLFAQARLNPRFLVFVSAVLAVEALAKCPGWPNLQACGPLSRSTGTQAYTRAQEPENGATQDFAGGVTACHPASACCGYQPSRKIIVTDSGLCVYSTWVHMSRWMWMDMDTRTRATGPAVRVFWFVVPGGVGSVHSRRRVEG